MRTVRDIPHFENVPIIVRAAMNVPIEHGVVANDYRIRRALGTIRFLTKRHARVIIISHIGEKGTETLEPVVENLKKFIPDVSFCPETIGPVARAAVRKLAPGQVLVLENLRRNKGEVGNDPEFAKELSTLGDVFVEDSFDTCHREHASIVSLPKLLPSYAGLVVEEEVTELSAMLKPKRPSLAAIGGAKFSTKEVLLDRLLEIYDHVFVGGALATDFFKAAGYEVGQSLVSGTPAATIRKLAENPKIVLPVDSIVAPSNVVGMPDERAHTRVTRVEQIHADETIRDHGPETVELLTNLAHNAKTILWNGPFGYYENGFVDATDGFAAAIASSHAHSVVGGGDTVASIANLGLLPKFSFVSTGGGAMLDFLAAGSLPGITALDS